MKAAGLMTAEEFARTGPETDGYELVRITFLAATFSTPWLGMHLAEPARAQPTIDHVIAKKHGGRTAASNLVLACFPCNNHKGPNIAGRDPVTKKIVPLFNPRRHRWTRHFRWEGAVLVGKTAAARATIAVLAMNGLNRVKLRQALIEEGVFPPPNQ